MDQRDFDQRISQVVSAARKSFHEDAHSKNLEYIIRRIQDANNWSEAERWRRFWRDCVGYTLSDIELSVLKHRGGAIHNGYILLTEYDLAADPRPELDRRPYEERLKDLSSDAQVFRNVVNRVLLILLGYRGEFLDFADIGTRLSIA